jgi:hypothetical protein
MVPRTPNRAVGHDPFDERAVIVRAVSTNREKLVTNPRQQHCFLAHMAEQHCSICQFALRNAKGKIRTIWCGIRHAFLSKSVGEFLAGLWLSFARPLQLWGQRMDVNIPRRMAP